MIAQPGVEDQVAWLRFLNQYQGLKPLSFLGTSDGMSTQNWKKDVNRKLVTLGANQIEIQRLATFSLEGEAV